jgi:hypothetical protein
MHMDEIPDDASLLLLASLPTSQCQLAARCASGALLVSSSRVEVKRQRTTVGDAAKLTIGGVPSPRWRQVVIEPSR